MDIVNACVLSLTPILIRTTVFINTYSLLFRPWIVKQSPQPNDNPPATALSTAYALFQAFYIALFWYSGVANEPWITLLIPSPWNLWAGDICHVLLGLARTSKRPDDRVEKQSSLNWKWKLIYLLPIHSAAATDASCLLLADRLRDNGREYLEENRNRMWLVFISLLFHYGCMWGDWTMLRKMHIPLFPPSPELALNAAGIIALRMGIAWLVSSDTFPMLEIVSSAGLGSLDGRVRPDREAMKADVELHGNSRWGFWNLVTGFVMPGLAGWFLARAKEDVQKAEAEEEVNDQSSTGECKRLENGEVQR